MRILTGFVILALSAGSCLAAPKFASSDEFSSGIVGKTISSKTKKGIAFTATFAPGGSGTFKLKGKKATAFKWTMSGTEVCWIFDSFKECNNVEVVSKSAANFYDSGTGKLNNAYKVK